MQYDPIKKSLGNVFNQSPVLRILFYKLLDLLLLRAWHIKSELRKLRSHLPSEMKILDAGSGFGQYSYFMSKKFKKAGILGVDVKEEQIADCNDFFSKINLSDRVKFEIADLTLFSTPSTYNLILSVDVMEHIEEDVLVFRNFHNSLTDGGVLLISTPSGEGGSDVHGDHDESFIDEHVRDGYPISEIHDKLKEIPRSGVEVTEQAN
jgi:cyclopropane fatty-acyl-phospholipid synthase-like methyltransferase